MVKFYIIQIALKNITIDEVPSKWRDEVKATLEG